MPASVDNYEAIDSIAADQQTQLYRCRDKSAEGTVLLKYPHEDYPSDQVIASLNHEYQLLKKLKNKYLVEVVTLLHPTTYPVLVMKDFKGITLDQFIGQEPVSLDDFFKIMRQLVETIGHLHRKHIVHKDIRPTNILIHPKSLTVKLGGLGQASELSEENELSEELSWSETSLPYIAPEQTGRINHPIDLRTDFYALGVICFELLTGQRPFQAEDVLEWVYCHVAQPPPRVTDINSDIPEPLAQIVNKLLAKSPDQRYSSVFGLEADLSECERQWREHQTIKPFELGQKDIYDHLYFTYRLYGRDQPLDALREAFFRVREGQREFTLVGGYTGIGKTALIQAIGPTIIGKKGYFVQGKFDQIKGRVPFSAVVTALKSLVSQVLSESEARLEQWQAEFNEALGRLGRVIIDVVPQAELILGEYPELPKVPPQQEENRFHVAFQRFMEVFARQEHPLVIFLDDLQWADRGSLKWIDTLMRDPDLKYFLLIGAYRSHEVDRSHPLSITLDQMERAQSPLTHWQLLPLYTIDIEHMLSDIFGSSGEKTAPLAQELYQKTHGNPFFMRELLRSWHQEQLLYFDYDSGQWEWDLDAIQKAKITENVVEWLHTKMNQLSETTQHVLQCAACFGFRFRLANLIQVTKRDTSQIVKSLWEALQARILVAIEPSYRTQALVQKAGSESSLSSKTLPDLHYQFIHDRVQQSIESQIPKDEKPKWHRQIGQLLTQDRPLSPDNEALFDIVYHFNQSLDLVEDPEERKNLLQANLWAAEKAKKGTAYYTALDHVRFGFELLPEDGWSSQYELAFALQKELAECHYLVGELETAETHMKTAFQHAHSLKDELQLASIYLSLLTITNRPREAIDAGLKWITRLGVRPPVRFTRWPPLVLAVYTLNWPMVKLLFQLRRIKVQKTVPETLKHPAENFEVKQAMDIMRHLLLVAFIVDRLTYLYLVSQLTRLSLKYGATAGTALALISYAAILAFGLGRVETGFVLADMAETLIQQSGRPNVLQAEALLYKTGLITTWREAWADCIEDMIRDYQMALESGKIDLAFYALGFKFRHTLIVRPLSEAEAVVSQLEDYIHKHNISLFGSAYKARRYFLDWLQGVKQPDLDSLVALEPDLVKEKRYVEVGAYYYFCMIMAYVLGDYTLAIEMGEKLDKNTKNVMLSIDIMGYAFYVLSLAKGYENAPNRRIKHARYRTIKRVCKKMKRVAQKYPCPHLPIFSTMAYGELYRVQGKLQKSLTFYNQAITLTKEQDVISMLGFLYESAATVIEAQGNTRLAHKYIRDAHYGYERWGAKLKCDLLEEAYSEYFREAAAPTEKTPEAASAVKDLDVFAILKASQAISEEIQLNELLQKLLTVMVQEAGAERAVLIYYEDGTPYLEAESKGGKLTTHLSDQVPIEKREDLPLNLLKYVARTRQSLVWQKGAPEQLDLKEHYIDAVQPETLLALPITYQGELRRMLYLENRESKHRLTQQHLQSLQLLASQAAISLENATLYYQATHDVLTGLANRSFLQKTFDQEILRKKQQAAIVFMDMDKFKHINDTYGHDVGDAALIEFGKRLESTIREEGLAVRLGGDEFVLLLSSIKSRDDIEKLLNELLDQLKQPVKADKHTFDLNVSIGVSQYPQDGKDLDTLLQLADECLYEVKKRGGGAYLFSENSISD